MSEKAQVDDQRASPYRFELLVQIDRASTSSASMPGHIAAQARNLPVQCLFAQHAVHLVTVPPWSATRQTPVGLHVYACVHMCVHACCSYLPV
jgi:hypothetical protein